MKPKRKSRKNGAKEFYALKGKPFGPHGMNKSFYPRRWPVSFRMVSYAQVTFTGEQASKVEFVDG